MARRPLAGTLVLGPFNRGLNTAKDASRLALDEATAALNVDLSDGTLRGMYGAGTTVATLGASKAHLHYEDVLGWASDTNPQFHTYDTLMTGGGRFSFFSDSSNRIRYSNGIESNKQCGIDAPTVAPTEVADGGGGADGAAYFVYTYITNRTGTDYAPMESNASPVLTTISDAGGCQIGVTASADAAVDGIRLYSTIPGATDTDAYYLISTNANTTATLTPALATTSGTPLTWRAGGLPDDPIFEADHSPPSSVNTIANGLHAGYSISEAYPASGILFLSVSYQLRWSMVGYPWYWPTWAYKNFPAYIECIVVDQAAAYVLTRHDVYVVTGDTHYNLTFVRSRANIGTTWGHSAVVTPLGLVYQTANGIALFDGNTSRIITEGILSPADLTKNYAAVWWEDQLLLVSQSDSSGGYVLDFSRGLEGLRVTTHNLACRAITRADAFSTPGPYVATYAAGLVGRWAPRQRGNVTGASPLPWSWTTGKIGAEHVKNAPPGAPMYITRIFPELSGDVSISVRAGKDANTTIGTQVVTGDSWLPAAWGQVEWVELTISSAGGAGILKGIEIEYEVAA